MDSFELTLWLALQAIRKAPGIAWRSKPEQPGNRDALLTTMAFVSPLFEPEFWVKEKGSYLVAAAQCRLDPEAAQWLLSFNDTLHPDLGYDDISRREALIERLRAELEP